MGAAWIALLAAAAARPDAEQLSAARKLVDRPPQRLEVGYRPADGKRVAINPPAFCWPPAGRFKHALQIARSPDFRRPVVDARDIELSVFLPEKPLLPGRWYWRYGAQVDGQVVWSRPRKFYVPRGVPQLSWQWDKWIEDLPEGHPRLFVRADELEQWRATARDNRYVQDLLRQAERLLKMRPEQIPEPRPYNEEERRVAAKRVKHWREMRNQATRAAHNAWILGFAYLATGDERFGQAGKAWLLHVCSWDPSGTTSLRYNDEAGMPLVYSIPRAYDWLYPLLSEDERRLVQECYRKRGGEAFAVLRRMPFHCRPYSSHPGRWINFLGEGAVCFYGEIPEAETWLKYILQCFCTVFPAWGGDDGGWAEGPNYWKWYIHRILTWLYVAEKALGVPLRNKPFFRNTGYFKLYTNPPGSETSPFGDACNKQRPNATDKTIMWRLGEMYGVGEFNWYAEQVPGNLNPPLQAAFWCTNRVRPRPPAALPQWRVFRDIGVAALHSDLAHPDRDVMVLFKSGPYGSWSHSHADQNSFYLQAGGKALFIDSGYYPWYSSPHHHNWTRETKAHNCITFDGGQGQDKRSENAKGRLLAASAAGRRLYLVAGDATQAYGGRISGFVRWLVYAPPGVLVIVDEVAAGEPKSWEWWLHGMEPLQADEGAQTVAVHHGGFSARCWLAWPRPLEFRTFSGFEPPPEYEYPDQHHFVASTPEPTRHAIFLAAIGVQRDGEAEAIEDVQVAQRGAELILTVRGRQPMQVAVQLGQPREGSGLRIRAVRTRLLGRRRAALSHVAPFKPLPLLEASPGT